MKILLVNKYLYPKGGDAVSTITTGELLRRHGHEVSFWGMTHPNNPDYPTSPYFVDYIDYNKMNTLKDKIKIAGKLLYSLEARTKVEKLVMAGKPDIVHLNNFAHQISPSILGVFKKYGIPVVMTMRDYKMVCASYSMLFNGMPCEQCKGDKHYWCFIRKCTKKSYSKSLVNTVEMYLHHKILHVYDKIDIYISPSAFLMEKTKEMGLRGEVTHLLNFVDAGDSQPQYHYEQRRIIYFGRLAEEKGLLTLLEAVKGLDVELEIIGEGPQKSELEDKVSSEGIKNISFSGHRDRDALYEKIKSSMFIVTPSEWYENNPRTVIEAFAFGKPVIGSRIGGIPEMVIPDDTGLLFTPGDPHDLRKKIRHLLGDPDAIMRMGKNARLFYEKELSSASHYKKLMRIYNLAIKKNA